MGYTAMRGGLEAIERAEALLAELEAGAAPDLSAHQVRDHLRAAVDRAMSEGGLYDPDLAGLAVRQAEGDPHEAAFLLRAYRSTLPRLGYSEPCDGSEMDLVRRITPAFKSTPGGQLLGRTRDYSQRLLDFGLVEPRASAEPTGVDADRHGPFRMPKVADLLRADGLLPEPPPDDDAPPYDITREPLRFPAPRSARLQALARGETGAMTTFAYSSMRGYGVVHSTLAELRVGFLPLRVRHPYTGESVRVGEVLVTEVEDMTVSRHTGAGRDEAAQFGLGYGLVFGQNERKAIAMAILDRAIDSGAAVPAADEELVLQHVDGIEAAGFVEHLKLPHYVELQAIVQRMRSIRAGASELGDLVATNGAAAVEATNRPPADAAAAAANGSAEPADEHARLHALGVEHGH
ncbi:MAG: carbon-phosphorus lyase complex subunit PhnI [Chloroflexi bacterium]|nr:carbon-phosphorus lyase complex subunit PhnI [Chloroflexota bacterium]